MSETIAEQKLKPGHAHEGESDTDKAARQTAIREAYSKASTWLREQHLDEFNSQVRVLARDAGYDWRPKPTKVEKAKAELKALLAANPELSGVVRLLEDDDA